MANKSRMRQCAEGHSYPSCYSSAIQKRSELEKCRYLIPCREQMPIFLSSFKFQRLLFTFPIGKVLSRSKKSISRFWRIFTFLGPRSPKKWILKNVRLSVCLSVCLSSVEVIVRTIVTINLKFGMWTQNVNISSRFFDIFFILIIKGSLP